MRDRDGLQTPLDEHLVRRIRVALEHEADGRDINLKGDHREPPPQEDCVFCHLAPENCVVLHASPRTVTILDRTPVARGHSLVIVRRHAPSLEFLTDGELAELFAQARLVAQVLVKEVYMEQRGRHSGQTLTGEDSVHGVSTEWAENERRSGPEQHRFGYNLGVNNGRCAGQSVPHVHVHVIPRAPGDGFWCTHRPWGMELAKRRLKANRHRL
jgi:diadenosine tetraphosphate (Ap4A) HIT family hydrolase